MDTTSKTKACPVTELVHLVVPSCTPHLTLVTIFESENEVLTCPVEAAAEEPFFRAESTELVLVLIFKDYESSIWTLKLLNEGVHGNAMFTQPV